jgi:hypothetical protein
VILVIMIQASDPLLALEVTLTEGDDERTFATSPTGLRILDIQATQLLADPTGVVLREIASHRTLTIKWKDDDYPATVRLFSRKKKEQVYKFCGTEQSGVTDEFSVTPSALRCEGDLIDQEAILEAAFHKEGEKPQYLYLRLMNRRLPWSGTDMGIALTLVRPLKDDADEGFTVSEGIAYYYAWSRLKNEHVRAIAQAALLDFADDEDFEIGIGAGLMFRTNGFSASEEGLGVVMGAGYNFMVDRASRRPYSFVGLSLNFGRDKKS